MRSIAQNLLLPLWLGLLLLTAVEVIAEQPADSSAPELIPLLARPITDVIVDYEARGFRFLYSTGLVRPSLKFKSEPPLGDELVRLRLGLEELGLTLRENGIGIQLIVRVPRNPSPQLLRGRVLDAQTGKPLSGVRVELEGQVLTTDSEGLFQLRLQKPTPVLVSHSGYQDTSIFGSPKVQELLEISLAPERIMDEIVVVSSRYAVQTSDTERHLIDMTLMNSIPRLGEDPLRITNHLPGMASIGVSAKPHIRGGLQDELLVLFNNLELLEPFHLRDFQSVFSSFNPSLIQSIDVYTGGFPARYGDRMSGVMDIRPANETQGNGGEISLSLLNAGVMLHGETHSGRGDWMLSGRRGNLDIVTKEINSTVGEPSYSDWFGQYRFEIDAVTELDVGFIAYNDDIELRDFDADGEIAESRYQNFYAWAQLNRFWSPTLDGTTIVYYGDIDHDRVGVLIDDDLDNGTGSVDDRRAFRLWALTQTFNFAVSPRVETEFGLRYTWQNGRYDYNGSIERGALAEILGTNLQETRAYRLRPNGGSGGVFASARLQPSDLLVVEAGVRWDFQDYTDDFTSQFSPRLSIKYDVGENTELRASVGRFFQPEGIHELQIGDGLTSYQDVQYADHFIIGWHQRFGESGFSLRTEAFSKNFHDPKQRFENLFNPLVLLPELASDRVQITPDRARARGFESTLRYQRSEHFMTWLTFTQTEVEDRIDGRWQHRAWDQGETISAGLNWQHRNWTVGAALLWHDGWRTTQLPAQVAEDQVVTVQRNAASLRDYLSLDVQISRMWQWPRQSLTAFLEVTNLLSRRNIGGIEYDVAENENAGGLLLTSTSEELLPLVPSIGIRWQF